FYRISPNSSILNDTGLIDSVSFKNKFECFIKCSRYDSCFLTVLRGNNCKMFNKLAWKSLNFTNGSILYVNKYVEYFTKS
ncbi:unnamed protein product, partial [Brachionus calyciflorus]